MPGVGIADFKTLDKFRGRIALTVPERMGLDEEQVILPGNIRKFFDGKLVKIGMGIQKISGDTVGQIVIWRTGKGNFRSGKDSDAQLSPIALAR